MTVVRGVTKPTTRKRKSGRVRVPIPIPVVISCLEAGFTQHEIACHLGIHHETLRKRIEADAELAQAMENGPHLRRRALKLLQWTKAKQGNVPMLIHLGKAELGQGESDRGGGGGGQGGVKIIYGHQVMQPKEWEAEYAPMRAALPREDD